LIYESPSLNNNQLVNPLNNTQLANNQLDTVSCIGRYMIIKSSTDLKGMYIYVCIYVCTYVCMCI
jgi:hypothetical protein